MVSNSDTANQSKLDQMNKQLEESEVILEDSDKDSYTQATEDPEFDGDPNKILYLNRYEYPRRPTGISRSRLEDLTNGLSSAELQELAYQITRAKLNENGDKEEQVKETSSNSTNSDQGSEGESTVAGSVKSDDTLTDVESDLENDDNNPDHSEDKKVALPKSLKDEGTQSETSGDDDDPDNLLSRSQDWTISKEDQSQLSADDFKEDGHIKGG